MMRRRPPVRVLLAFLAGLTAASRPELVRSQTPLGTSFTYQGRLSDGGSAANGTYDVRLVAFDAASGGTQTGPSVTRDDVVVTNGVFTVPVDFGVIFGGSKRWLEIGVRPGSSAGAYTPLGPRQELAPSPNAVWSASSGSAVQFTGSLSGDVAGAQGATVVGTVGGQSATNVAAATQSANTATPLNTPDTIVKRDVNGSFSANVVNAATQFDIAGARVLGINYGATVYLGINAGRISGGNSNTFVGGGSAYHNTSGGGNAFFGTDAGNGNTEGIYNVFLGLGAGYANTTSSYNTFVGSNAGDSNTTASFNAFFGANAGRENTEGAGNSFAGGNAGRTNTTGSGNSFFGGSSGFANTAGQDNSFFGFNSGVANTLGNGNSFFGSIAGQANTTGAQNSFFGLNAGTSNATGNNNSFFGASAGLFSTLGFFNSFVGSSSGLSNTTGGLNSFFGVNAGQLNTTGSNNTALGAYADVGTGNLTNATAIGAGAIVSQSNSVVLGSNANVGIGVSSPLFKMHVRDSQNAGLRVQTDAAGGTVASFGGNGGFEIDAAGIPGGRMSVLESGNVGIGTAAPNAKLQVEGGSVYITAAGGLVLRSPNGACWSVSANNGGALTTLSIPCP